MDAVTIYSDFNSNHNNIKKNKVTWIPVPLIPGCVTLSNLHNISVPLMYNM